MDIGAWCAHDNHCTAIRGAWCARLTSFLNFLEMGVVTRKGPQGFSPPLRAFACLPTNRVCVPGRCPADSMPVLGVGMRLRCHVLWWCNGRLWVMAPRSSLRAVGSNTRAQAATSSGVTSWALWGASERTSSPATRARMSLAVFRALSAVAVTTLVSPLAQWAT
jgi:hypothetical protein